MESSIGATGRPDASAVSALRTRPPRWMTPAAARPHAAAARLRYRGVREEPCADEAEIL